MFTWGLLSGAMAFVQGEYGFYAVRLLLGAAETGFFPGVIFFLTLWVPASYRARLVAAFMAAMPVASVIGSPVSGLLMQLNGVAGLKGWQWMFLVEAVPALLLTVAILNLLRDSPGEAPWLSTSEREWLKKQLDSEPRQITAHKQQGLLDMLFNPLNFWLGMAYFGITGFNYGLSFFLPQIVRELGLSILQTGFISAIPCGGDNRNDLVGHALRPSRRAPLPSAAPADNGRIRSRWFRVLKSRRDKASVVVPRRIRGVFRTANFLDGSDEIIGTLDSSCWQSVGQLSGQPFGICQSLHHRVC
jgi:MFS family permease